MITRTLTSKQYIQGLARMPFLSVGGQLLFAAIIYWEINYTEYFSVISEDVPRVLNIVTPIIIVLGVAGSFLWYNARIKKAKNLSSLSEKLAAYRKAVVTRFTLLQTPSMFCIITAFATKEYVFGGAVIAIWILAFFSTPRPVKDKLVSNLNLTDEEALLLSDPAARVTEVMSRR